MFPNDHTFWHSVLVIHHCFSLPIVSKYYWLDSTSSGYSYCCVHSFGQWFGRMGTRTVSEVLLESRPVTADGGTSERECFRKIMLNDSVSSLSDVEHRSVDNSRWKVFQSFQMFRIDFEETVGQKTLCRAVAKLYWNIWRRRVIFLCCSPKQIDSLTRHVASDFDGCLHFWTGGFS